MGGIVFPNWLCFSSGVILETRSAALSLNEYAGFRYIGFFAFSPPGIKAIIRIENTTKTDILCCLIFMNEAI
jgi:hypothetical protein